MNVLLIDNFDSFTHMLADYVLQCGADCTVVRNTANLQELEVTKYDAVILSPGPCTPNEAGITLSFLKTYATQLPILGVCLGHQAIGQHFGASVIKAQKPMHGKVSQISYTEDEDLFDRLSNPFEATRYHSLVIKDLPACLIPIAISNDTNEIMAIKHETFPVYGVQFHPESCLTKEGLMIIENFLALASISRHG